MLTLSSVYKISLLLSVVSVGCSFSKRYFEKFEVQLLLANPSEFLLNQTQYSFWVYAAYHFLHFEVPLFVYVFVISSEGILVSRFIGMYLGAFPKLQQSTVCFVMSVLPSTWNNPAPIRQTLMKYLGGFRKFVKRFQVSLMRDTSHEDQYTFLSSHSLLRMRNVSDKSCRGNQNTHFMFNNSFLISCSLWDNVEKYCRAWQATWHISDS
jgi:hypothetical protein